MWFCLYHRGCCFVSLYNVIVWSCHVKRWEVLFSINTLFFSQFIHFIKSCYKIVVGERYRFIFYILYYKRVIVRSQMEIETF